MQLTRQGDYAVRAVYALAAAGGRALTRKEIARLQGIPEPFLAKIVQLLSHHGLVTNTRGVGGGITLARPAAHITLRDVVEAAQGPTALNLCLQGPGACSRQGFCAVHPIWIRAQAAMLAVLASVTFADLMAGGRVPAHRVAAATQCAVFALQAQEATQKG